MIAKAPAFAVLMANEIAISTVSATERGAKVNGLVSLFAMLVMDTHTDAQITVAWDEIERRVPGVRIIPVEVAAL